MVYQLLNIFKNTGVCAVILISTASPGMTSTEYVFTAPPEVNRKIVEIPSSNTDYPLYQCITDTTKEADALEAHDCKCPDCENKLEESELELSESISETKVKQP